MRHWSSALLCNARVTGRRCDQAATMRREADDNFQLEDGAPAKNVSVLFWKLKVGERKYSYFLL